MSWHSKLAVAAALLAAPLAVANVAHADRSGCSTGYGGSVLASDYHATCYGRITGGPTDFRAWQSCAPWTGDRVYYQVGQWKPIGSGATSTTGLCFGLSRGGVDKA